MKNIEYKQDSSINIDFEHIAPACTILEPYLRHPEIWRNFEKVWASGDKDSLELIIEKMKVYRTNCDDINAILTKEERAWLSDFFWRALLWGLC